MRPSALVVVIASLVTALAACSPDAESGKPVAAGSPASSSARTAPPGTGAARPAELDLKPYADDPCALVTASQLAEFGSFKSPTIAVDESGPGKSVDCSWQPANIVLGAQYSIGVYDFELPYDVLKRNMGQQWDNLDETTIDGYPAITGFNSYGIVGCSSAVSVADGRVFLSGLLTSVENSPEYANPCDYSKRFAAVVLKNLKG
ncbi:DUF3558 domain-containing protein [Actinosynnema pretiosum]|uniref:DUF3558 domain-containing protein n=1 Tax=Actinosynnema pretiosum TaxID=42197 RepID=UPI0012FE0093|nr:DUF3558 domain-containing protein [Actinosynnema pretiosum]